MKSLVPAGICLLLVLLLVSTPMIGRAQTVQSSVTTSGSQAVFVCGGTYNGVSVTCTGGTGGTTTAHGAPEIDLQFAASGLVFIFGCLAILRGRKRS